jgi:hypothetical protein
MSYALDITDLAAEDLVNLLDALPISRRADAFDSTERALSSLAENPLQIPKIFSHRPTYLFWFLAGGVYHYWGATFRFSEDEKFVVITHIFRVTF